MYFLKNGIFIERRWAWDKFIPFSVATERLLEQN